MLAGNKLMPEMHLRQPGCIVQTVTEIDSNFVMRKPAKKLQNQLLENSTKNSN